MNQIRDVLASRRMEAPPNQLYRKKAILRLRETLLAIEDLTLRLQSMVSRLEAVQNSVNELAARIAARTQ